MSLSNLAIDLILNDEAPLVDFYDIKECLDLASAEGKLTFIGGPVQRDFDDLYSYKIWGHQVIVRQVNWKRFWCGKASGCAAATQSGEAVF